MKKIDSMNENAYESKRKLKIINTLLRKNDEFPSNLHGVIFAREDRQSGRRPDDGQVAGQGLASSRGRIHLSVRRAGLPGGSWSPDVFLFFRDGARTRSITDRSQIRTD